MKYKTAMAAVFGKYRNPRTRTSALALLERYSGRLRPITAWHALGEDAGAARLLLETLGFREKEHFTVQTSVLDPASTRFSWTDAGMALVATMSRELGGVRLPDAQRRVLAPGTGDPLELLSDTETPAAAGESPEVRRGIVGATLEATTAIAKRLLDLDPGPDPDGVDVACVAGALRWASTILGGSSTEPERDRSPVAPLAVLEILARLEKADSSLPPFPVFDASEAEFDHCGWSCSRAVRWTDGIPSGRLNCLPLGEQRGPCGQLDGFFAWNAEEFRRFPQDRDAVWTQFDAKLVRTAEALNFALDAEKMRQFAVRIVENGYHGFNAALSTSTRLAVPNTTLDGVPGNENLEDDDGDPSSLLYRIEDSVMPNAPVYMGAFMMSETWLTHAVRWAPPTAPVSTAPASGEESVANEGLTADEAADEWFSIVHGLGPAALFHQEIDHPWDPASARRVKRVANLNRYRAAVAGIKDNRTLLDLLCSPFNVAFTSSDGGFLTCAGAFVQGLCAALRKYAPAGAVRFCEDSLHHRDKIVAGVWTGLMTDLAPCTVDDALTENVFPNLAGYGLGSYEDDPGARTATTMLLDRLRSDPWLQFKFGRRTRGTHRNHAILIETNMLAKPFVEGIAQTGASENVRCAVWRAFHTSFLCSNPAPLASLDDEFHGYNMCGNALSGFSEWVREDVPDWADASTRGLGSMFPGGDLNVLWREDELGRLVVMVVTGRHETALRAKLAYRYVMHLPLPTAAYLSTHGRGHAAAITEDMSMNDRYKAVLRAALRQPGFMYDCVSTRGSCGRFGSVWIRDLVWDLDSDECPSRAWYRAPNVTEIAQESREDPF